MSADHPHLRDFLLGKLIGADHSSVEERFLADEDFATELCIVEDELIESYLRQELSTSDRRQFENSYLANPRRRERVLAMKAILAITDPDKTTDPARSDSVWRMLAAPLRSAGSFAPYALAAAALVIMVVGVWLLYRPNRRSEPTIVQSNSASAVPSAGSAVRPLPTFNQSQSPAAVATPDLSQRPSPAPRNTGPTVATITLQPRLVRDPTRASRLVITPTIKTVLVQLNLERDEYTTYRARLTTIDDRTVWQSGPIRSSAGKISSSIVISVPATRLTPQDYLIEVSGFRNNSPAETVASYFFTVVSK